MQRWKYPESPKIHNSIFLILTCILECYILILVLNCVYYIVCGFDDCMQYYTLYSITAEPCKVFLLYAYSDRLIEFISVKYFYLTDKLQKWTIHNQSPYIYCISDRGLVYISDQIILCRKLPIYSIHTSPQKLCLRHKQLTKTVRWSVRCYFVKSL